VSAEAASSAQDATSTDPDPGLERERAIVEGMRAGDDRAFEWLVRDYIGPLQAVALRLLQHQADADDAVQEAFLNAFRRFDSFRSDARLGTWLHRIVVNAALGRLRKRKSLREVGGEVGGGVGGEVVDVSELLPRFTADGYPERFSEPWVHPVEELAAQAETREQVRRMIDKLPDTYRTVLVLRDIEELDTAETAELLGISPGAVKVRLHRARQALRNLLERELELTR
jgi:RNA polymerase sigma-70 factor, ECF subfamily